MKYSEEKRLRTDMPCNNVKVYSKFDGAGYLTKRTKHEARGACSGCITYGTWILLR